MDADAPIEGLQGLFVVAPGVEPPDQGAATSVFKLFGNVAHGHGKGRQREVNGPELIKLQSLFADLFDGGFQLGDFGRT